MPARPASEWRCAQSCTRVAHEARYNLIARPGSSRYQNSTAFIAELIAAAQLPQDSPNRAQAQAMLAAQGFAPDVLHIPYAKRVLGGLFAANIVFTDHSLATRLEGRYPVVTVRAIKAHLRALDLILAQREFRGGEAVEPGAL